MSAESIRIMCPKLTCKTILAVPVTARGKVVRCKNCGTTLRVPAPPTTATSERPASS